jgi:hypothetical protein
MSSTQQHWRDPIAGLREMRRVARWAARNRDLAGLDAAEFGLRLLVA